MRRITLIIAMGIVASFIISCSNPKPEVTSEKTPEIHIIEPNVLAQIETLNDSVNHSWDALIQLDIQKFANIKRLVEEISYCKKYNEKGVEKALKLNKEVIAMMYTQENLSDSIITLYDTKTDDLIRVVRNLKTGTEEIAQHPLADQLENEIMEADALLVNYRNKYDQIANEYNSFLDKNKEAIVSKSPEKTYSRKRLFSVAL
jgi:GTPase SAR1 family protein